MTGRPGVEGRSRDSFGTVGRARREPSLVHACQLDAGRQEEAGHGDRRDIQLEVKPH